MSFNNSKSHHNLVHNQHNKWLCIILTISILICSTSPVFAIGPNSTLNQVLTAFEAGKNVGEMFALLMGWNQTGTSVEEAILISIAAELQYIFDNGYAYNVVNPYTGSSPTYYRSSAKFGEMFADLNNSLASFGNRFMYNSSTGNSYLYDLYLLTGRMEIILGGANGNNLTAISAQLGGIGQILQGNTQNGYIADNIVPTLNSIDSKISSLDSNINNISWNKIADVQSITDSNNNTINGSVTVSSGYIDFAFGNINVNGNNIYSIILPISAANFYSRNNFIDSISLLSKSINGTSFVPINIVSSYTNTSTYVNINFSDITVSGSNNSLIVRVYIKYPTYVRSALPCYISYINDDNIDYYLVSYLDQLRNLSTDDIVNTLENKEINVEINDSVNVTPVKLDISIGINDFDAANRAANKLREWLTTGVGILSLIAAMDSLDDSFFIQENQNIIETINYQYTDFYD